MDKTKLGLITVLYHSNDVLPDFLKGLSTQSFQDFHLYLVDNSTNSETDQLLAQLLNTYPIPAFSHIKNKENLGAAGGNNEGITQALGDGCEYLLLLNNDIEIDSPYVLASMLTHAKDHQEPIIIPKLLFHDTRTICMAGGILNHNTATTTHVGVNQQNGAPYNTPAYFNFAPTTFMLLQASVFSKVGLLDERYFAYYEDTDFIYRATLKGYHVYYMPSVEVLHKESSLTGGHRSPFFVYYINRNRILFIKKHFQGVQKLRALMSMGVDFLRMFRHYNRVQRKSLIKAMKDGALYKIK